jgi:hypothetical protein
MQNDDHGIFYNCRDTALQIAWSSTDVENCKNHFNLSPEPLLFPQILLQLPGNDK